MARFFKISLFLFLLIDLLHNTSGGKKKGMTKQVLKALGNMPGILGQAFELWQTFESVYNIISPKEDNAPSTDDRLDMMNEKIDQLSSDMKAFENRLNDKLDHMDDSNTLERGLTKLFKYIDEIDYDYSRFSDYTNESLIFLDEDMEQLIEDILSKDGVEKNLKKMHDIFRSTDGIRKNIPMLLMVPSVAQEYMCALHQSTQQYIHTLYQNMMLTEVKGYAMLLYANEYRKMTHNMTKTSHSERSRNLFKNRTSGTFDIVKKTMAGAQREIWRCDSQKDGAYARVGPVFQKYVLYEDEAYNISTNQQIGCSSSCSAFSHVRHQCQGNCTPDHCQGNVRNCEEKRGNKLSYCLANDGYRRYEYINYDDNLYGDEVECPGKQVDTDVWKWKVLTHCYYCFCTCENTVPTIDKYISLRSVLADSRQNKVVVAARLQLKNNIFHIQIKQGKLLPNGRVKADEKWTPAHNFKVGDPGYDKKSRAYYEITWDTKKILLDDLYSASDDYQENHVLTGLMFQQVEDQVGLGVFLSEFNFTTGKLGKTKFHTNPIKANERSLISLEDLDVPSNHENNKKRSKENEYLEFTMSDLKKDAGQNVLPFIDVQPIEPSPHALLGGAGLFLRADKKKESGGYLSLKLFTLDTVPFTKEPKLNKKKKSHE